MIRISIVEKEQRKIKKDISLKYNQQIRKSDQMSYQRVVQSKVKRSHQKKDSQLQKKRAREEAKKTLSFALDEDKNRNIHTHRQYFLRLH